LTQAGSDAKARFRAQEQSRLVHFFIAVAADVGNPLDAQGSVLDFGCGDGDGVAAWRAAGYEAFGCDIVLERPGEGLYLIEEPYRLPFPDASFDLVVSDQVLEHVHDHDVAFMEISRVLKPGAISLHLFPSRWAPREVHAGVPLASVVRWHWWFALWARLGIRNEFQSCMSWREVTDMNLDYLRTRTNYVSRRRLLETARRWFQDARFVEDLALKHGRRTQRVYPLVKIVPPLARLYSGLRARFLLLRTRRH
jgi:SAM-dependent methyltransferase